MSGMIFLGQWGQQGTVSIYNDISLVRQSKQHHLNLVYHCSELQHACQEQKLLSNFWHFNPWDIFNFEGLSLCELDPEFIAKGLVTIAVPHAILTYPTFQRRVDGACSHMGQGDSPMATADLCIPYMRIVGKRLAMKWPSNYIQNTKSVELLIHTLSTCFLHMASYGKQHFPYTILSFLCLRNRHLTEKKTPLHQ